MFKFKKFNMGPNTKKFIISFGAGFFGAVFAGICLVGFFILKPNTTNNLFNKIKPTQITAPIATISENSLNKTLITQPIVDQKLTPSSISTPQKLAVTDVVRKSNPAVVSIIITQEVPKYEVVQNTNQNQLNPFGLFSQFNFPTYRQVGTEKKVIGGGSGFLITSDGYIITNKHVISRTNAEYTVQLLNGKKYDATVIARDATMDIGVLKIVGTKFPYLSLGNSDKLEIGEQVVAIGNALAEFQNSVSQGIVSGLGRNVVANNGTGGVENLDKVIQTDAAINPGNSGGPLINMKGQVIGVNVAVVQGSQSIGFALPINAVRPIVKSILKNDSI
jgi:S1-C subfamily serine protease